MTPKITLSNEQRAIVINGMQRMFARLRTVEEGLNVHLGRLLKPPTSLRSALVALKELEEAIAQPAPLELRPEHAPMVRAVLQAFRREVAEDVERKRENIVDPEIKREVDSRLDALDVLVREEWFVSVEPTRIPRPSDFVNLALAHEIAPGSYQPLDRPLEDKFRILLATSQLGPDLKRLRDECAARELPLSVVFLDIDSFKAFNEKYGEVGVDRDILPPFMRTVEGAVFGHGTAYRYGGDEFVLLLPNSDCELATTVLAKLMAALASQEYPGIEGHPTISIGLCIVRPDAWFTDRECLELAGRAKKAAKGKGKNQAWWFDGSLYRDEDLALLLSGPDSPPGSRR